MISHLNKKIVFALLNITLSVFHTKDLSASQTSVEPRNFKEYETQAAQHPKIMIMGSSAGRRSYPQNFYLIDKMPYKGINPDLLYDVTTPLPHELNGKFDVVVLEHLPIFALTPATFDNAARVLKVGGILLMNFPGAVTKMPSTFDKTKIKDLGDHFSCFPNETIPYSVYTTYDVNDKNIQKRGYEKMITLVEEKIGTLFKDFKIVEKGSIVSKFWHKEPFPSQGVIEAVKK